MARQLPPARARELIPAEALATVPGFGPEARVSALAGGQVNHTYRVDTAAGQFVLRWYGSMGVQALGANHAREALLQGAAAAAGVAPAVVHMDFRQRFMICDYVEGRVWAPEDFATVGRIRQLGETLHQVHGVVAPVPAPFDLGALLRGFAARIAREVPAEQAALAQWMAQAQASLPKCGSEGRQGTLFHSDLHHSNILQTRQGGLVLIDWEYAAVGDPLYDLACVLAYYPQAAPYAAELLAASGLAQHATLEMLEHATRLYALLGRLWERTRQLEADKGAGVRLPTPAD